MIKHIISTFFTRSAVAFTNFLILLLASRYLGSSVLGEVSVILLSITLLQTVNEIYTGSALVYFIPKVSFKSLYLKGLLWTICCLALLNFAFYLFDHDNKNVVIHVCLLSLMVTLNAFHSVILLGFQRIKIYNIVGFIQPVLLLGFLFIQTFLFHLNSLSVYLSALYVSFGITLCISSFMVIRLFTQSTHTKEIELFAVLKNGFLNQLGNLSHTLSNRFNYYMLATNALVGVYASSTSLIESLWIISGSVSPVILTYIVNQKNVAQNDKVTFLLSKICFLLSLFAVAVLYFLPPEFFTFLLGKDFSETRSIMLYLSPGVICISFSSIISHYFSGQGNQRILFVANFCGLLVTLSTSYFFITSYGIIGACYSASLSYIVQALVLTWVFMLKNKIKLSNFFILRKELGLLKQQ